MKASKITEVELDFDQMTCERLPAHVQESVREHRLKERERLLRACVFEYEQIGERPRILVPEHMQGKRVRVTLEVIE